MTRMTKQELIEELVYLRVNEQISHLALCELQRKVQEMPAEQFTPDFVRGVMFVVGGI